MRKIVCRELAPPDHLVVEDVEPPQPGPGQVVVDVAAAGVTFADALIVQGKYQIKPPVPFTPGTEIAGQISAVGEGAESWSVGDRVMATTGLGAFAEQVAVRADGVLRLPAELSFGQGASFGQSYATMMFAYTRRTIVGETETVLVLGAGGGIGLAAIDLAKALGARVIAAASSADKLTAARATGAEATIAYEDEDLKVRARELGGGGVDVVVDAVGGSHAEPALRALRLGGRFLVLGFASGTIPSLPLNQVLLNNRTVVGVEWGGWALQHPDENRAMLDELLVMAADGRLHPAEPAARPLAEAGAVLADMVGRRVTGKVVLVP
jgi:NADPH2:quinone reductase